MRLRVPYLKIWKERNTIKLLSTHVTKVLAESTQLPGLGPTNMVEPSPIHHCSEELRLLRDGSLGESAEPLNNDIAERLIS